MRDPDELFTALARSKFRSRFRLGTKETSYLDDEDPGRRPGAWQALRY